MWSSFLQREALQNWKEPWPALRWMIARDWFSAWCKSDGERADDVWIDCVGRKESEQMYARNVHSGVCDLDLPQEVCFVT